MTLNNNKNMSKEVNPYNVTMVKATDSSSKINTLDQSQFNVKMLPGRVYTSPLVLQKREFIQYNIITDENKRLIYDTRLQTPQKNFLVVSVSPLTMQLACARKTLHFNNKTVVVGIVTCGDICPGLNDVIRNITLTCIRSYHVKKVLGFRYGFWGLSKAGRDTVLELTSDTVRDAQKEGGTIIGISKSRQKTSEIVDTLVYHGVRILFTIGGNGTQRCAIDIVDEVEKRKLDIVVFGIPKAIDNDLSFSQRTFGFETAVGQTVSAIRTAYAEASSHEYSIGIVKVLGKYSGFIAAEATVSSGLTNICLIPEMPITKEVFLNLLKHRLHSKKYCVIVVAEGFGQNWLECSDKNKSVDEDGNLKLVDIGVCIKGICEKFLKSGCDKYALSTVKYIDPSFMIRACTASSSDASFCSNISTLAVHEAMSGCTGCLISQWYSNYVVIPMKLAISLRNIVSIKGPLWRQVRELTVDLEMDNDVFQKQEINRDLHAIEEKHKELVDRLAKL